MKEIKVIYQDQDLLVVDKPPKVVTFREKQIEGDFLMESLIKEYPFLEEVGQAPRHGAVHRLDKDTSGIVLVALNNESFLFFQKQFKERKVLKEYLALCVGQFKQEQGVVNANIGRSPKDRRKQKVFPLYSPRNPRLAVTRYQLLKNFQNYALIRAVPETGRRHQIRCHMSYLKHPIAGDLLYGFKNQPCPKNLERHFLHAQCLAINTPSNGYQRFFSDLPDDLKKVLEDLTPEQE
jgi:23S rRNA pseudouridine1911/1915/1917 synthase